MKRKVNVTVTGSYEIDSQKYGMGEDIDAALRIDVDALSKGVIDPVEILELCSDVQINLQWIHS